MQRFLLCWSIVSLFSLHAPGQNFRKVYVGRYAESAESVLRLRDGGYVVSGYTTSSGAGDEDVLLMRFAANGSLLWAKTYGGVQADRALGMIQNPHGGVLLVGYSMSFSHGERDILVISTDGSGRVLWSKVYGSSGDETASDVHPVGNAGFILCGQTNSFGTDGWGSFLLSIGNTGDMQWFKTYDVRNTDGVNSVVQVSDGGFLFTGLSYLTGAGKHDALIVKTDPLGEIEWASVYGEQYDDSGYLVRELRDGDFLVAGNSHFGKPSRPVVFRVSRHGELQWSLLAGTTNGTFSSFSYETDSTMILAGSLENHRGFMNPFLMRVSHSGRVEYSTMIPLSDHGEVFSIANLYANTLVLAGHVKSAPQAPADLMVMRIRIPLPWETGSSDLPVPFRSSDFQQRSVQPRVTLVRAIERSCALRTANAELQEVVESTSGFALKDGKDRDHGSFDDFRKEMSRVAEVLRELREKIRCDFSGAETEIQRAEAMFAIGENQGAWETLRQAENLLLHAQCGETTIEEVKALGRWYHDKEVAVTGTITEKIGRPMGDGYSLVLSDGNQELPARFSGNLEEVSIGDRVQVLGTYSNTDRVLVIRSFLQSESPPGMGLLLTVVVMLLASGFILFRLRRRRSAKENRSTGFSS